ncbi:MAG: AsmA-like C-terminal domain-containing protein [Caldimicrobium sp.]
MMKRFFLFLLAFFLLFLILIGIISFNLEFFLNKDFFKRKLTDYIAALAGIRVDYNRVHINLYQLKVDFEGFRANSEDFEIFFPKGRITFSKFKLLKKNFYPQELYLKNPYIVLKAPKKKEEKPFEIQEIYQFLLKSSPISLSINNGTFAYYFEEGKGFSITNINLFARDKFPQVFFNLNATSSVFSFLDFKGRLNYQSQFFEGSLRVKKLDLSKVNYPDFNLLKKTELDLSTTISLEKDVLNIGFTGSAPCLAFAMHSSPFICGFFQGYFVGGKDFFELKLSSVNMKYPEVKGEILFQKDKSEYLLKAKLDTLSINQIKEITSPYLSKKLLNQIFDIVKAGLLENLSLSASGKSLEELFNPHNLKISAEVKGGEIFLAMLPLYVSNLEGKLFFEKGKLDYQGKSLFEDKIFAEVKKLDLNLFDKKETIGLDLDFEGESKAVVNLIKRLAKKEEVFDKIEVSGLIKGSLQVSRDLNNPEIALSLRPINTSLKTAYFKDELIFKKGEIFYKNDKINFQDLGIDYRKSSARGIKGEIDLNHKNFYLKAKSLDIKEDLMVEFLENNQTLKDLLERYKVKFDTLRLKEVFYQGNLEKFRDSKFVDLLTPLFLEGEVDSLSLEIPINNETFSLKSQVLSFSLKSNILNLLESQVFLENSPLTLTGNYYLTEGLLTIIGRGIVSEELLERLNSKYLKNSQFSLKQAPLYLESFNLNYSKNEGLSYRGEHLFENLRIEASLKKGENLILNGKVFSEKNQFSLGISQIGEKLTISYQGTSDFEELSKLFEKSPFEKGKIEGDCKADILISKLFFEESSLSLEKISTQLRRFLAERPLEVMGNLILKDLKIKNRILLSGNFLFTPSTVEGNNLRINFDNSSLWGNLVLSMGEKAFDVEGDLHFENLNLKEKLEKEEAKREGISYQKLLTDLPLNGKINLGIEKVVLPTSHKLEKFKADIVKKENLLHIQIPEIKFCGLNFYAEYESNPEFQYLFADLKPTRGDFLDLSSCLYPEEMPKIIFEGPFKMEGFFYTDGKGALLENSYGKMEVSSDKGYIYRAPLIAKVLGFLSPIDLFKGKIPNLENDLLPYEELNLIGEFRNSSIYVDTFFLSAPGFRMFGNGPISIKDKNLDLTFLVSPFKTVDVVLEHIPFVNEWALGKERMLIYLPLEVIGTYDEPTIVPLHPASIGKGLFRFIFKFFGIQEEFFKKPETFEGFKKPELFKNRNGNTLRR